MFPKQNISNYISIYCKLYYNVLTIHLQSIILMPICLSIINYNTLQLNYKYI